MERLKLRLLNLTAALLVTLFCGHPAVADDTEVLIGSSGKAYVVFIIDTSGSMGNKDNNLLPDGTTDDRTRLKIVQDVFGDLMTSYEDAGINVAVMRFDSTSDRNRNNTGGSFITPMQPLTSSTGPLITTAVNNLTANSSTPLAETLYEAGLFFRGGDVHFGNIASPNNVDTVLDPDDTDNTDTYLSPITSQCQKNTIILLTDGKPRNDAEADTKIQALPGYNSGSCSFIKDESNCLDELAEYLHTIDQSPDDGDDGIAGTADDGIEGAQTVETYTIGFTTDQALLEDTAKKGGGEYKTATNAAQLSSAFEAALGSGIVVNANTAFSAPALAANAFNNISHTNKLYFTLFEPSLNTRWDGNVKPYSLTGNPPQLTDADGNAVINPDTGLFLSTSRSFFSSTDDGIDIPTGGANSNIPDENNRNLYTYTGGYTDLGAPDTSSEPKLYHSKNSLVDNNNDLTPAMLGLTGATASDDFKAAINKIRKNRKLGDPLHSKPALITYGVTGSNPDITLFVATNGGFLHALDASPVSIVDPKKDNGQELFAFMPKELLDNLPNLANDSGGHPYGLDGNVTAWVNDDNNDGDLYDSDDHVYVYVGMRRGGSNYYALDVTDRKKPTLEWVLQGGIIDTDFSELGQSWSQPAVTTIKYGSGTRKVLIFGGGYDTAQDDHPTGTKTTNGVTVTTYGLPDSIGRAIFIVDAETGERLWWAGPDGCSRCLEIKNGGSVNFMTNSIPSDVKLFDSDFDGLTDRLYVGDMRGQIFRVDLQATLSDSTGVRLASLGSEGGTVAADNRRFFYPPDVVVTQQPGVDSYVSINIGSGYRAGPLNPVDDDGTAALTVSDRFYSLRDPNVVEAAPSDFPEITHSLTGSNGILFNATTKETLTTTESTALDISRGWFITLGGAFGKSNGEKVLASSITLNGVIYFTTYTPPSSVDLTSCAPPAGTGSLYSVSLFDATPPVLYDDDGIVITAAIEHRVTQLNRPGIPSSPTIMFRENKNADGETTGVTPVRCVGTECEPEPSPFSMVESYWKD